MDKRLVKLLKSGKIGRSRMKEIIQVGNLVSNEQGFSNPQRGRVYDTKGIAPCLDNLGGGGREVKIVEYMKDLKGFGRTRSADGRGITHHFNEYVNCLHSQVGRARENMEVLVAESMDVIEVAKMSKSWNSRIVDPKGISYTITNGEKDGMPKILQNAHGFNKGGEHIISPTITGSKFQDNNVVCEPLRIRQATKQGYIEVEQGGGFDATYPESTTRRGRVQEGGNIAPTLMASGDAPCRYEGVKEPSYRIRKLTPRECFRLMGVDDQDIDKIQQSGVSHTQQYKMAGNSIVVDCLYHIFRKLFTEQQSEGRQLTLF